MMDTRCTDRLYEQSKLEPPTWIDGWIVKKGTE